MSSFKTYEFALGVLATVAVVAVAMVLTAGVPPESTNNWNWGLFKDASGFFALCAVVVASAQAVFFVRQLHYMRRDIETSDRTLQHIAYESLCKVLDTLLA